MSELLKEAKKILLDHKGDQPARDSMTKAQREALANDLASRSEFLSASHFEPEKEKSKESELMFWEYLKNRNNYLGHTRLKF